MSKTEEIDAHGEPENRGVRVDLGVDSYDISIGKDLLSRIDSFISFCPESRALFVLTDEHVLSPHAVIVYERLKKTTARSVQILALPPGEQMKSFAGLERTAAWLLDHGVDRHSVIFAVGGGVIGDLAGFAAATMMRGIPFVQVPTTLLAQVDSAVGGKTAINMPQGKNLVGVFHQPCAVIADTATLETLPHRQILAGYAEIVKYALIDDPVFFTWLENGAGQDICTLKNPAAVARAIETSCYKKAAIVAADEKEKGVRALLNLGHTFGHALEAAAGYDGRILHGEAVSVGMVLAFALSVRLGLCPQDDFRRVRAHLSSMGLPVDISDVLLPGVSDPHHLLSLMGHDKKRSPDGGSVYVLADGIGKARIVQSVSDEEALSIIEHSFSGLQEI